jgi:hypothetical protein
VAPAPTRRASSSATSAPAKLSSRAALTPTMPAPTTTTSHSRSVASAGYSGVTAVSAQ